MSIFETRRATALVVDEDDSFLALARRLLVEEGVSCDAVTSAGEALAKVQRESYDVLLFDVALSPLAGPKLLETARQREPPPVVLIVTAHGAKSALVDGLSGVTAVLGKPVDAVELSRLIAWALHVRHSSGQLGPEHFAALYKLAATLNAESNLTCGLDRLLEQVAKPLRAMSGSVMLAVGPELQIRSAFGLKPRVLASSAASETVSRWVVVHKRPLHLVGPLSGYPQFAGLPSNADIGESLVVPIIFRGETLGIISMNAARGERFQRSGLALLIGAADLAASAIHRERIERHREHQDRLALLGELSASIAHELNNPMAFASASALALKRVLAGAELPDEAHAEVDECLTSITEGLQRMSSIAAGLTNASRQSSGELSQTNLSVLLARAESLVAPQLKHRAKLTVEPAEAEPLRVDASRVLQVLINLLLNAGHAVGGTGRPGEISLRGRVEGEWALIEVEDNGAGVRPEIADKLFEPFFTTKPEGEGTGLGLSISRQIASDHGGDLTFRSRPGEGTTFTLRLPLTERDTARPTIMLVEPDDTTLKRTARALKAQFDVREASTAQEALAMAGAEPMSLILVDELLASADGEALLRSLKEACPQASRAVLADSASRLVWEAAVSEGLLLDVVQKTASAVALVTKVRSLATTSTVSAR